MQAAYLLALVSFAASSLAIAVTSPSQGTVWSSSGPHTITWTRVSTDPDNCAVTLVQQGVYRQTLADSVSTSQGSLTITSTLPVGNTYQVNIVRSSSAQDLNTILAQSAQFDITQGGAGSATTVDGGTSTTVGGTSTTVGGGTSTTGGGTSTTVGGSSSRAGASTGPGVPNASNSALTPTSTSSATSLEPHGGFLPGIFALAAAVLM